MSAGRTMAGPDAAALTGMAARAALAPACEFVNKRFGGEVPAAWRIGPGAGGGSMGDERS